MSTQNIIEELSDALNNAMPDSIKALNSDLRDTFRDVIQNAFEHLDLVTREEFDTQKQVLLRTREKLEALEKVVAALESSTPDKKN